MSKLFKKPKVPKPIDPSTLFGQQAGNLLGYYREYVPQFLGLQKELSPEFLSQYFSDAGGFLGGLTDLIGTGVEQAGEMLGEARGAELAQMTSQAPLTRALFEALSPEAAAQVQASTRAAEQAYRRADQRQLSPQEQRDITQQTREAYGSRGMLGSTGSVASEILNRDVYRRQVQQQAREEAAQAGARAFNLGQQFYGQGLSLLSQAPLSYQSGANLASASTAGGQAATGEFDYNMPIGLAQQRAGALDQYNMAKYQAKAQRYQSKMNLLGQAIGLAAIPFTGGLSAGLGLGSMGGALGSGGFNLGASLYNIGAGAFGAPLKAKIV